MCVGGGGLLKAIGRKFAGETMFLTEFTPADGESLFLTALTGPDKIIIQSMTLHNLASALAPFLPNKKESSGSSSIVGTLLEGTLGKR